MLIVSLTVAPLASPTMAMISISVALPASPTVPTVTVEMYTYIRKENYDDDGFEDAEDEGR